MEERAMGNYFEKLDLKNLAGITRSTQGAAKPSFLDLPPREDLVPSHESPELRWNHQKGIPNPRDRAPANSPFSGPGRTEKPYLTTEERRKLLDNASTWTDTPYRKAGKTRAEADCSGSVWAIFNEIGLTYFHKNSHEFPSIPEFEKVTDPQPGDVVRWNGHLAIVAEEKGKVWSARRPGERFGLWPMEWFTSIYGAPTYYRYLKKEPQYLDVQGREALE